MNTGEYEIGDMESMPAFIGNYRLLAELGHGGMARVFLAVQHGQEGFRKLVVLKTIRVNLVDDPETLQMFLDEARIAGRLNHPNVVTTNEITKIDGHHIMVMEYLDGQSLASILRRVHREEKPAPLGILLRCISNALEGLNYAHELKDFDGSPLELVHRDVSPQNIFVTYDGSVKILDFGIAKATMSSSETRAGVIKGKIAYMAPEQFLGEMTDRRVDIYAMGAVLWHIATGKRLWRGMVDGQVIHRVINNEIPKPSSVNPNVNPRLDQIIMKALARNRSERYQTCLELQADIDDLIERLGEKVTARDIGTFTSDLFADERKEIASVIEAQLSKAQSASTGEYRQASLPALNTVTKPSAFLHTDGSGHYMLSTQSSRINLLSTGAQTGEPHSISGKHTGMTGAVVSGSSGTKKIVVPAAIAACVLAAVVVAWKVGSGGSSSGPISPLASGIVTEAVADRGDASPSEIVIEVKAQPATARVSFNGVEVIGNPASRAVPKGGPPLQIRVQAAGYEPLEFEIPTDKDIVVAIALDKMPAASAESASTAPRSVGKGSAAGRSAAGDTSPAPVQTSTPQPAKTKPSDPRDRIKELDKTNPF